MAFSNYVSYKGYYITNFEDKGYMVDYIDQNIPAHYAIDGKWFSSVDAAKEFIDYVSEEEPRRAIYRFKVTNIALMQEVRGIIDQSFSDYYAEEYDDRYDWNTVTKVRELILADMNSSGDEYISPSEEVLNLFKTDDFTTMCELYRLHMVDDSDDEPLEDNSFTEWREYRGYIITYNYYGEGEITVYYMGKEHRFRTVRGAKSFVDRCAIGDWLRDKFGVLFALGPVSYIRYKLGIAKKGVDFN